MRTHTRGACTHTSSYTNARGPAPQSAVKHFVETSDLRISCETLFKAHGLRASRSPGRLGNICPRVFRVPGVFQSVSIGDQQHTPAGAARGSGVQLPLPPAPRALLWHTHPTLCRGPPGRAVLSPGGCRHPGTVRVAPGTHQMSGGDAWRVQAFIPCLC